MKNFGGNRAYSIRYHPLVGNDLSKVDISIKEKIKKTIEEKLTTHPEVFGKPLRKSLKGYRSLRIGDYRAVFCLRGKIVFVLLFEHRSVVYKEILRRM